MTELTRQSIIESWQSVGIIPLQGTCDKCGSEDLLQHQNYCVECMLKYAKFNQKLKEESKGKCSMCGKKLTDKEQESDIPYLKNNTCNKCLRNSF